MNEGLQLFIGESSQSLLVFYRERRVKATISERMFVLIRDDDDDESGRYGNVNFQEIESTEESLIKPKNNYKKIKNRTKTNS